jgi:hypothetical protein
MEKYLIQKLGEKLIGKRQFWIIGNKKIIILCACASGWLQIIKGNADMKSIRQQGVRATYTCSDERNNA